MGTAKGIGRDEMKRGLLVVSLVALVALGWVTQVEAGCGTCGTHAAVKQACGADCAKPCCAAPAVKKACGPDCKKPCCDAAGLRLG